MAAKATVTSIDNTQNSFIVTGTVALSGTYPTNGDTLDLSQLGVPSSSIPFFVELLEQTPSPGPASGYAFSYLPGTTQANGVMEVFNGTTQFTTQAYGTPPFAITGFVLGFRAYFVSLV
jgi:hypothetical protein